jgi:hypothetical protein
MMTFTRGPHFRNCKTVQCNTIDFLSLPSNLFCFKENPLKAAKKQLRQHGTTNILVDYSTLNTIHQLNVIMIMIIVNEHPCIKHELFIDVSAQCLY